MVSLPCDYYILSIFAGKRLYGYFSANDNKKDETQIDGVDDGADLHLSSLCQRLSCAHLTCSTF